jgi:hypothetical protein
MLTRLHTHVGSAGLIVAIIALIAALGGAAVAATSGSGGGKATASAKAKQGPRGKTGKTGPTGPAGPAGPQGLKGDAGATGSNGKDGTNGTNGKDGTNGTNGTSATTEPFSGTKGACTEGGVVVKSASPETTVCNGKKGADGTTGFTATLPSKAEETGTWWFSRKGNAEEIEPISFPIPLSSADAASITVHFWRKTVGEDPECPGSPAEPVAEPGTICFYVASANVVNPEVYNPNLDVASGTETLGVGPTGALLYLPGPITAGGQIGGSFAVTAP